MAILEKMTLLHMPCFIVSRLVKAQETVQWDIQEESCHDMNKEHLEQGNGGFGRNVLGLLTCNQS